MLSKIRWKELEELVASCIKDRYQHLDDAELRIFCEQLRDANAELVRTVQTDPNYELPLIGEAYILKYHLGRADNLYTALNIIKQKYTLPEKMRVLDIGSGTGGTMMAIVLWIANNMPESLDVLEIYGIEPMPEMKALADCLREPFLQFIEEKKTLDSGSMKKRITHAVTANSLETLANLETDEKCDLIVSSFTFPIQSEEERQVSLQHITKVVDFLNPGGLLLFLTPNKPAQKKQFRDEIVATLANNGAVYKLDINVGTGKHIRYPASERPTPITDLRRAINIECRKLELEDAFGEDPEWDDPYYGFYCNLDVFIKN